MTSGTPGTPSEILLQDFISYLSYPQISEQSVQWLLRTRPDKILADIGTSPGDPFSQPF